MGMAMTGSPMRVPAHCDHMALSNSMGWRAGAHQSCSCVSALQRQALHRPAAASNGDTWSAGDRPGDSRSKRGGRRVGWAALRPHHNSKRDSPTGPTANRCNMTPVPCLALRHPGTGEYTVTLFDPRLCFNGGRTDSLAAMLVVPTACCWKCADTAADSEEDRSTGSGRSAGVVHDSLGTGNVGRAWQNAAKLATKGRCAAVQHPLCEHAARTQPDVCDHGSPCTMSPLHASIRVAHNCKGQKLSVCCPVCAAWGGAALRSLAVTRTGTAASTSAAPVTFTIRSAASRCPAPSSMR